METDSRMDRGRGLGGGLFGWVRGLVFHKRTAKDRPCNHSRTIPRCYPPYYRLSSWCGRCKAPHLWSPDGNDYGTDATRQKSGNESESF